MLKVTVEVVPGGLGEPRGLAEILFANVDHSNPTQSVYRVLVRDLTARTALVSTVCHCPTDGWETLIESALREVRHHGEPAPAGANWWEITEGVNP